MEKRNGCIFLISARKNLLGRCLKYLDQNYNNQFNYPILIFYHGDKYDDLKFRNYIKNINKKTRYTFHKIKAKIPKFLKEKDMFWNLPNNKYAKSFTSERLGYLHANFFWNNFMNFEELKNYDYLIRIDDDSWIKNKIDFDFFNELDNNNKLCGCAYTWNNVHHRVLETRVNFFKWIRDYVNKYNVNIKNENLKEYISQNEIDVVDGIKCNKNFHSMKFLCGNCNVYNRKLFESDDWNNFLKEFNKIAGGYRYRWGDCETISMFYYLYIGDEFLDMDLINKKLYHNQIDKKWDKIKDENFVEKKKISNKSLLYFINNK